VKAVVLIAISFAACAWSADTPEIRIYSEFQRFDPFGNPVASDREMVPREILSPAMPRNGHLSLQVVINGPAGTNYFLYAASNPPDILQLTLYREHFTPCGASYCPDWLTEQSSPAFGAIPESIHEPDLSSQTSRSYLLDIWARPDTPPRRVRVEALLKVGTWLVAPLEVRVVAPEVPDEKMVAAENIAALEAPASATAQTQLLRYLAGLLPQTPPRIMRARDITQRNAAEDMLLARSLGTGTHRSGFVFPELNLVSWWPLTFPEVGAEWYLRVRDFLNRFE
jgi:hypothetical protein